MGPVGPETIVWPWDPRDTNGGTKILRIKSKLRFKKGCFKRAKQACDRLPRDSPIAMFCPQQVMAFTSGFRSSASPLKHLQMGLSETWPGKWGVPLVSLLTLNHLKLSSAANLTRPPFPRARLLFFLPCPVGKRPSQPNMWPFGGSRAPRMEALCSLIRFSREDQG